MFMATKNGKTPYTGPKRLIVLEDNNRITTILCRERSGKFIEYKSFTDHAALKKYRQRLTAGSENVEILKLVDPWSGSWDTRYDLAKWKDDPDLVLNVPELLSRFELFATTIITARKLKPHFCCLVHSSALIHPSRSVI